MTMTKKPTIEELADYYDTHDMSDDIEKAVPAEPPGMPAYVTFSVRLPRDIVRTLRARAEARGMGATVYARELLEAALLEDADTAATVPVSVLQAAMVEYLASHRSA